MATQTPKPIVRTYVGDEFTDREMTDTEYAQWQAAQTAATQATETTETAAKAQAAARLSAYKKLAALGLTADEIAAL